MRKFLAVAVSAAVTVGVTGALSAPAAQGAATRPAASVPNGYNPPPIKWHKCADATLQKFHAQCGRLIVPLNYNHPRGTKIQLAVSRVLHTVPDSKYQGVMLTNPGGPGGSGLTYSLLGTLVPHHAGDAYDWIGFDPRGVGSSTPSLSCNRFFFHGDRVPYIPRPSGS